MSKEYVEQRNDGYYIKDSRVSLDSIVYSYWNGETAETIAQSFPVLKLSDVYGAITFYLEHRNEIDNYLKEQRADYEEKRIASRETDPMFYKKLEDIKRELGNKAA